MLALQALPEATQGQFIGLLQLLTAIAIVLALTIIALAVLTYSRSVRRTVENAQVPETQLEEDLSTTRPSLDKVTTKIIWMLDGAEAIPVENVKQELSEYSEILGDAVNSLLESGVVHVSGGMLVLSEKGRKLIELLKEKHVR